MTLFHDNRRKDFIEQVVHHIATVSLLGMTLFLSRKWTVIDQKGPLEIEVVVYR